jgi:chitodextrinase
MKNQKTKLTSGKLRWFSIGTALIAFLFLLKINYALEIPYQPQSGPLYWVTDSIIFEAEDAESNMGTNSDPNRAGFTGTGYREGFTSTGYITYTVNMDAARTVQLHARYAYGRNNPNIHKFEVNGTDAGTFNVPRSGGWNVWVYSPDMVEAHLNEGSNTIRHLPTETFDGGNVDHLLVVYEKQVADIDAPTVPQELNAVNISDKSVTITWQASVDNFELAGYRIYVDGVLKGNTGNTTFTITDLTPETGYDITVSAYDASENESEQSIVLSVTTQVEGLPTGIISSKKIYLGSGENSIIVYNVSDNTPDEDQTIEWDVQISDTELLEFVRVDYDPENTVAFIIVREKGVIGSVELVVTLTDPDGTSETSGTIEIAPYDYPGAMFSVLDAYHWQDGTTTYDTPSLYETHTPSAIVPEDIPWDELDLTVSATCINSPPCNLYNDFAQFRWVGYIVAPETGEYTFQMISTGGGTRLWLSNSSNHANAVIITNRPRGYPNNPASTPVGTISGDGNSIVTSDPIMLNAGQVYAYYGFSYRVHLNEGEILWSGPGLPEGMNHIGGQFSYAIYDTEKPTAPGNASLNAFSSTKANISWDASKDNQGVDSYNIYVNGLLHNELSNLAREFTIEDLVPDTQYSVFITAKDRMGNESDPGTVLTFTTWPEDNTPPEPVTNLGVEKAAGMALQISWDPAIDNETAIYGYNIYLDDILVNEGGVWFDTTFVISVLQPEVSYNIRVEAIDAGYNTSSASLTASTTVFDPLGDNLGVKTGRAVFSRTPVSMTKGIGINANYTNGIVMNELHTELLNALQPATLRWGAIEANSYSFSQFAGAGKPNDGFTIGKFFERAAEFGAVPSFTCGVGGTRQGNLVETDWMKDLTTFNEETFLKFLEYVNGPDNTTGGALRAAEGYTEPFLNKHDMLIFEFGNEVWGRDHHYAFIGGDYDRYAAECRRIAEIMKASPYYDHEKIRLVYSSRRPSLDMSFGLNQKVIQGDNGLVDWTGPSGYTTGNLNYDPELPAETSEIGYYNVVRGLAFRYLDGMDKSHIYEILNRGNGVPMQMYLYESNTTLSTYNGRLGQAVVSIDYYLSGMERGAIPVIFHLTAGQWAITANEDNNRPLAMFQAAQLFNNHSKGDILTRSYESNLTTVVSHEGFTTTIDPVGAYSYVNEAGFSFVFLSRDFQNDHYVELNLPDGVNFASEGNMYIVTGDHFSARMSRIDSIPAIDITDKMIVKVPKYSMVMITVDGDNKELSDLPLAYINYPKADQINIEGSTFIIDEPEQVLDFSAVVLPEDVWIKNVTWKLLQNTGGFTLQSLSNNQVKITAPETLSNDFDHLILRATMINDTTLYAEARIDLDNLVNVNTVNNQNQVRLYPNPAAGMVNIVAPEESVITIYSVGGLHVKTFTSSSRNTQIDISDLKTGFYIVTVRNRSGVYMRQLIKE